MLQCDAAYASHFDIKTTCLSFTNNSICKIYQYDANFVLDDKFFER